MRSSRRHRLGGLAAFWLGLLGGAAMLLGQATDGNLVGTVTDPAGMVLPNATITATNKDTGVKYTTKTTGAGDYRINDVPVGSYDVDTTATGMAASKATDVTVDLNRTTTLNVKMSLATASTVVEVVEAPPLIDTTSGQLQTTFGGDLSVNLPAAGNYVNDSGVLNLSLLAPGVAQTGGMGYGEGPSVGGQRPTNNSFNIDGVDNNRHDITGPMALVPNDAVQQFTLLENQFSPEFGGSSGGIFNTITKSGTNDLHGSLYEYLNNRNLNAITSQEAVQGFTSNPRYDYNRFGGTIGGPIIKNKLFYFGDYEYSPLGQASVPGQPIKAPTAAGYQTLSGLPGISKTNLGIMQQYLAPAATQTGTVSVLGATIPVGTIPISGPSFVNKQNVVAAIDYTLSEKDQLRGRYYYNRYSGSDTYAALPVFYTQIPDNRYLISLSEFHTFSPTLLNEFRLSYDHKNNNWPVGNFKFPGLDQFPNLTFDDLSVQLGPDPNAPQGYIQGSAELTDNVTKTMGKHTFKAGYHIEDIIAANSFIQRSRGDYDYSSVALYLQDLSPDVLGERSVGVAAAVPAGYLFHAAFFNDDYKIKPNLTINLGVRYEYVTVPVVSRYQPYSALADVPGLITFGNPQSQKNNWAPRVGFAWSPGTSGKWSIRSGFGLSYDNQYNNLSILDKPAYFQQTEDVPSLKIQTPSFLAKGGLLPSNTIVLPTNAADARAAVSAYTPDQIRPYAINATLAVQRSLGKNYTLEARYVYTKGVHLFVQDQLNRYSPISSTYGLPTFFTTPTLSQLSGLNLTLGDIQAKQLAVTNYPDSPSNAYAQYGFTSTITDYNPVGNSRYNGLALSLTKRYSNNFSYMTNFTWSHAQDDSTATVYSTVLTPRRPEDFRNLSADWGDSPLDRRLRFVFTPTYDVKLGSGNWLMKNIVGNWNLSATYTYQSPARATPQSGIDSNLNNDSVDRTVINASGKANLSSAVYPVSATGAKLDMGDTATVAYVAMTPNARYVQAGYGAFPNGGRDTLKMFPIDNIDLQVLKRFAIKENLHLELGGQFSNILNHPQWTGDLLNDVYPNTGGINSRSDLLTGNPDFGRFDLYYPSNSRTITVVGRIVF